MNARIVALLAATGASLLLSACSAINEYPVSYQVPIGAAYFSSDYGLQNLPVNAVQDVPVEAGMPFYYTIVSPVAMNVYIFDKFGPQPGGPLLGNFSGASYSGVVTPSGNKLEFVFSAPQPVAGGVMQLTVSDTPLGTTTMTGTTTYTSVALAAQPPLVLSPAETTTSIGQPVTLTVAGGAGNGTYVWGGPSAASGISNMYTFSAPGTYTVTVYRTGDASYMQSNTATATISITAPQPVTSYPANPGVTVTPVR